MNYRKFYFSRVVVDRGIRPRHIFMAIVGTIFMAVIVPLGLAGAVGLHIGRVQMQEFEALNKLRQIAQAEEDYRYGVGYGYYGTFEQLVAAKLLAPEFAAPLPTQDSYVFKITLADKDDYGYHLYSLNADPEESGWLAFPRKRHYYLDDAQATVRIRENGPATAADRFVTPDDFFHSNDRANSQRTR